MNWPNWKSAALSIGCSAQFFISQLSPSLGNEPIVVTPHPQAGKLKLQHNPDRPLLAAYGGIGLRQTAAGLWTGYGRVTSDDVDYLLRRCQQNGLRRIHPSLLEALFPGGDAANHVAELNAIVHHFFSEARAHGIEVFADLPVFGYFETADRQLAESHPHCFTRSVSGELDTHMLSAAYRDVRRYKRSILMGFVRDFPVAGLQLDFIRYPYYTMDLRQGFGRHGYDPPALAAFRSRHGLDDDYEPQPDDPRWIQLKAEMVSQFIRELRGDLEASGISLPIGVYNSGTYGLADSLQTVHQDWRGWEAEALVDEHHPMVLMSAGMTTLTRAMQTLLDVKNEHSRVFGPIFLAEGFNPENSDVPTADMVRDAARRLIKIGCDGLWFCRPAEIEQYDLWPVVREISQWSIDEIRSESFDPYAENLLKNADFSNGTKNWQVAQQPNGRMAPARCKATGSGLEFTLSEASDQTLSQTVTFRLLRQYPVDSLLFRSRISIPRDAKLHNEIQLEGRLRYANGEEETVQRPIKTGPIKTGPIKTGLETTTDAVVVKARTDFSGLVLQKFELTLKIPRGIGTLCIGELELQRDPLLWNNVKD
ncbi:family 10 glycosylhydrolase [Pirellulales bacterium]|nr:family 10 glycosylhydrolase [Pirellulales bacterium]